MKEFFENLWKDLKPILLTAISFGLNWLANRIKNRRTYKEFVTEQRRTQSLVVNYSYWKQYYGYPNPWQKSHSNKKRTLN